MTARRSTSDPVSHYLETGERVVWRHQPTPRALFYNRLPTVVIIMLMTAFLAFIAFNIISTIGPMPARLEPWLVLPGAVALFFSVLIFVFLRTLWNHTRFLLDSWSTHYALTNKRFLVVSGRGVTSYDASYFRKMAPTGGAHGKHVLMFDWGVGSKRREYYRDRLAALPDAHKLERLIRETLRA